VIWPGYFDVNATRDAGRRLPKDLCITSPRSDEIFHICRKLGHSPELQDEKRHPNSQEDSKGRVLVRRSKKKSQILKEIAVALQRTRK
jgi:signal recognition particle subunit SEC65